MSLGIKCQREFSYMGTGYCYVETTNPSIITDKADLIDPMGKIIQISSMPRIIKLNQGKSFDAKENYDDAVTWNRLVQIKKVGPEDYEKGINLKNKYGI